MATTEVSNYVEFNDSHGYMSIKTFLGHTINFVYDYNLTTFGDIANAFFNNYECRDNGTIYDINLLQFVNLATRKPIDKSDYNKLPRELNIGVQSKFNLASVYHYYYSPPSLKITDNINDYVNNLIKMTSGNTKVFIKDFTDKLYFIDVELTFAAGDLKLLIERYKDIPSDRIRMIYACRQLDDNMTLSEAGISNESTISLVPRLMGGAFEETNGKNGDYKPLLDSVVSIDVGK